MRLRATFRCLVACALFCGIAAGQAPASTPAATPPPVFDAATVHTVPPSTNMFPFTRDVYRAGKYDLRNGTMIDLVRTAYTIDADKIFGGPSWIEQDRFDVHAKTAPSTPHGTAMLMLQALLADRFKLAVHNDTRPMPVYALTLGKRKLQLKEPDASAPPGCRTQPFRPPAPGAAAPLLTVDCHNLTMATFGEQLRRMAGGYLDRPVIDKTGLEGKWDLSIAWTARNQLGMAGSEGISVFDALEKIGLKLESESATSPVLVVDRANRVPTPDAPDAAKIIGETPTRTEFEVAEIKPTKPDDRSQMFQNLPGGRLQVKGMALMILIQIAWDTRQDLVTGGPKWLESDRFDVIAKAPATDPPEPYMDFELMRGMLRALLIERFKLATHEETQTGDVYALIAPKHPPKIKKAEESSRTFCKPSPSAILGNPALTNSYTCQNITMTDFSKLLQQVAGGYIGHPVIDATELPGGWDFVLSWTAGGIFDRVPRSGRVEGGQPNVPTASDPNGAVSIFDAVEKLGLKLEPRKAPTIVLVIDHAEPPTDN